MSLPYEAESRKSQPANVLAVEKFDGMNLHDAALGYANAGWFVLPTDPTDIKNPGSVVRERWQHRSSRDCEQIRRWWSANPNYGIALHCGRSGAIVFDLDMANLDELPTAIGMALRSADAIQLTRPSGDRGHYVFAMPTGESLSNRAGAFAHFGEVRGKNGVIIAAPTPHPDGGYYQWGRAGAIVTPPPDALRECLSVANGSEVEPLTDVAFRAFLSAHNANERPGAMRVVLDRFRADVEGGVSRHYAIVKALGFGYRDAIAGYYPAQLLTNELAVAFKASYDIRMPGRRTSPRPNELVDAARYVAAEESVADPEMLRARKDGFSSVDVYRAAQSEGWAPKVIESDSVDADTGRVSRLLSDVEPAKVEWLWRPWLPLGKVSILEGDPDVGKSVLTLTMAAIVSTGQKWPETRIGGEIVRQPEAHAAGVVLVGVEDDEEDTIVPRLIAAGADRTRIATMRQPTDDRGDPVPFVIPEDVVQLRRAIREVDARLVVIDPVTAFLSTKKVKANDDPSTRQALMPVVALARETECAIVLVRHLNKATGMSAKHRGSGTIAYTGITRSVIVAGKLKETEPNGPTHAIALTKGNLTKAPSALGYRLNSAPDNPDKPVVWWLGALELSADQLVGADGAKISDARRQRPFATSVSESYESCWRTGQCGPMR